MQNIHNVRKLGESRRRKEGKRRGRKKNSGGKYIRKYMRTNDKDDDEAELCKTQHIFQTKREAKRDKRAK